MTEEQASHEFYRTIDGAETFTIPGISYVLDASNRDCRELRYLCAEFNQGDAYDTRVGSKYIPFSVYGVEGETDLRSNADNLIGCAAFVDCSGT